MALPTIRLQPQRHKRVQAGHPWIYSNEIVMNGAAKALEPGSIVQFLATDGGYLGIGYYNPKTLIAGRILTRGIETSINKDFFKARLHQALALRERLYKAPYYRLAHAEGDGLPGLVIDRFGAHLSVQLNTAGMENLWPQLRAVLLDVIKPSTIILHNESSVRMLEGLSCETTMDLGELTAPIELQENSISYFADLIGGQKTGWYYDQRENHALVARMAAGKSVLDLYTHAGGFALLAAAQDAAKVVGVDSSELALNLARLGAEKNDVAKLCAWHKADVFAYLEAAAKAKEKYGIVIADPPPFVKSRKDLAAGARGYRKLTRLSAGLVEQGGLLFIASCSHNMELERLTEEVAAGLAEVRRTGQILHTVFAAPDHPVHPSLSESAYLKGLFLRLE